MREIGRSMVEMLGVLAIIGVISIGAIAGYRLASDYYRANSIVNDVNIWATETAAHITSNGMLNAGETYETGLPSTNSLGQNIQVTSQGSWFSVEVSDVQQSVCRRIASMDWDVDIYIGPESKAATEVNFPDDCTFESSEMYFGFDNDFDSEFVEVGFNPIEITECQTNADCTGGKCINGRCVLLEETCSGPGGYLRFGVDEENCPADRPICLYNHCVPGCTSNDDCSAAEPYCLIESNGVGVCAECTQNSHCPAGYYCGGSEADCFKDDSHMCIKRKVDGTFTTADGTTYYISANKMPWWNANNFCKSFGKSLVPSSELDETPEITDGTDKKTIFEGVLKHFGKNVWGSTFWFGYYPNQCYRYYGFQGDGTSKWWYAFYSDAYALCR